MTPYKTCPRQTLLKTILFSKFISSIPKQKIVCCQASSHTRVLANPPPLAFVVGRARRPDSPDDCQDQQNSYTSAINFMKLMTHHFFSGRTSLHIQPPISVKILATFITTCKNKLILGYVQEGYLMTQGKTFCHSAVY
jgi:hypothetical protein